MAQCIPDEELGDVVTGMYLNIVDMLILKCRVKCWRRLIWNLKLKE